MANNPRTVKSVLFGIWVRLLSLIIPLTFPAHFTTLLFRLMGVKVGKGSKISRSATLDSSYPYLIEIGKSVWVTQKVMILCHERDLAHHGINKAVMDSPLKTRKVCISDGAHIGIGAIIMPGVTIGEGAVIGAGAVVTKSIPPYCVAVGVPAKVIKYFDKDEGHI